MAYDFFNFPTPYTNAAAPGLNFDKVVQTTVDNSEIWPTIGVINLQLNLFDDASQGTILRHYSNAARRVIESYLGRNIGDTPSTYDVFYSADKFNVQTPAILTLPTDDSSNITVSGLSYYNALNPAVKTLINPSSYFFDPTGPKIIVSVIPNDVNTYMTSPIVASISITQSDVIANDPKVIHAALLLITHYYNNRSAYTDIDMKSLPAGIVTLLSGYKDLYI